MSTDPASAPILLLASERSGTNLLRVMFDSHPQVCGPSAPHFLRTFTTRLRRLHGDLAVPANAEAFAEDCLHLAREHYVPWQVEPTPAALVDAAHRATPGGIVGAIYDELARVEGKPIWFAKEASLWRFVPELLDAYPDARILYLCRDGRDVTLSGLRSGIFPRTWAQAARLWREEQLACLDALEALPPGQRWAAIRYEDLLDDARATLVDVCERLGLPFDEAMLSHDHNERAQREAGVIDLWSNLDKPLQRDNTRKWLAAVPRDDIEVFERVAGDALQLLGYDLAYTVPSDLGDLTGAARRRDTAHGLVLRARGDWLKGPLPKRLRTIASIAARRLPAHLRRRLRGSGAG